jgi:Bacterial SH3 domain
MLHKLVLLTIFAAGGCAHGPAAVRGMDATKIQEVSDYRLCDAAAVSLDLKGRRYPVIESEIARRGISCAGHIAAVVNDCSRLQVLNSGIDRTGQGTIFTVRNDSAEARTFRIRHEGRQSRLFTIGPEMTERFGITADPNVPWLGEPTEVTEGDGGIELLECRTVLGAYRMQYRPQAGSASGAVSEAAPGTSSLGEGARSRATQNVNMRAGPSTSHAIVRTLRAGEEVAVLRVLGAWCECMADGGARGYVSCAFLSSR